MVLKFVYQEDTYNLKQIPLHYKKHKLCSGDICGEHFGDWVCTRPAGHKGWHEARDGPLDEYIRCLARWLDRHKVVYEI